MFDIEVSEDLYTWKTVKSFVYYQHSEATTYFNEEKEKIKYGQMKAIRIIAVLEHHKGHACMGCKQYKGEGIDCGGNGC